MYTKINHVSEHSMSSQKYTKSCACAMCSAAGVEDKNECTHTCVIFVNVPSSLKHPETTLPQAPNKSEGTQHMESL